MKTRAITLLLAAGFTPFFLTPASAGGSMAAMVSLDILSAVMPRAIPMHPLKAGQHSIAVSPALFGQTYEKRWSDLSGGVMTDYSMSQKTDGWAGALSYMYSFSEKWGLSLVAGTMSGHGTTKTQPIPYSNATLSGDRDDSGTVVSANAVCDLYSKSSGFRLPLIAGLSVMRIKGGYEIPYTVTVPGLAWPVGSAAAYEEKYSLTSLGLFAAISPQFETGPLRWSPFFFFSAPLSKITLTRGSRRPSTGQEDIEDVASDEGTVESFGLEVMYKPLNLSVMYTPSPLTYKKDGKKIDQHVLALRWSRKW